MSKTHLKLIIWAFLLMLLSGAGWLIISGIGGLIAYFQRGADPAAALNIIPNAPPDLNVAFAWQPDDTSGGRALEPFTRTQIESTYLRAWLQWNISYGRNQPYGLKSYFSGPALAAVSASVQESVAQGWRVAQADSAHTLRLHFYSADGAIVALTDEDATVTQIIRDASGAIVFAGETRASYSVVMILEDGNWHIRHWLRQALPAAAAERPAAPTPCPHCVALQQTPAGPILALDGQPYRIAGINYYPQATPWDLFWPQYRPAVIERDLQIVQSFGLNSIRIFVPYQQFGAAKVDPIMLAKLTDFLDRAEAHQIKVIVTLFDFRSDYNLLLWPAADRHLETLLTTFAQHPAILAWDLKNEPDRDYSAAGRDTVDLWLQHIAQLARRYDPNHLITIGWSEPGAASALSDMVDFVSFHFYAPAAELPAQYAKLRAAAPQRPIVLGEFGLPTWNSYILPNGHSVPEQAAYYADVLGAMRATDSAGYMAWTLYDFSSVPATVAGRWPWQTGPQRQLGVISTNGIVKPAAALLAPNASLTIARPPAWARFLKPFWFTVSISTVLLLLSMLRWIVRLRRRAGGR